MLIKDLSYVKINGLNRLYHITGQINGLEEKTNGNKCSTLVTTDETKEIMKNILKTMEGNKISN